MIRLLTGSLRGLVFLRNKAPWLAKKVAKPLGKTGRFFLSTVILPAYKSYLFVSKFTNKFYAPQKSRHYIIHPFSRRYIIHFIIIVISFFTVVANLNAYEIQREDFGKTSIFSDLVTTEDLGTMEEEGPITAGKKITRYMGQTGVAVQTQVTEGGEGEEILPSIVSGDSAVISQILSPVEEDLRQRDKIIYYTIQNGDTISQIAEKFGITNHTILWENNLTSYSVIRPGDTLAILPTSGIRHKVGNGETVAGIAKKYGVETEDVIEFNKLASANDIKTGETLMIPGGQKSEPAPVYTLRSFYQPTPAKVVSTGKMLWPTNCSTISQYFRYLHSGLDIACGMGKPIYAADGGTVIKAQGGYNGGYGTMIIIDHGGGVKTLYGHMSKLYVVVGEGVRKGDIIGAMGTTGRSTGPHLHFEVQIGGVRKNPLYYIK